MTLSLTSFLLRLSQWKEEGFSYPQLFVTYVKVKSFVLNSTNTRAAILLGVPAVFLLVHCLSNFRETVFSGDFALLCFFIAAAAIVEYLNRDLRGHVAQLIIAHKAAKELVPNSNSVLLTEKKIGFLDAVRIAEAAITFTILGFVGLILGIGAGLDSGRFFIGLLVGLFYLSWSGSLIYDFMCRPIIPEKEPEKEY